MSNPVGQPLKFKTPEELEAAIDRYFENGAWMLDANGERVYAPTMSGLALAIGIDRRTLVNYSHREEYFPAIKKARAKVEEHLEQRLYGNSVAGLIFNLKNNFGWTDKQEIANTHSGPNGGPIESKVVVSPEEAYKRMLDGNA